MNRVGILVDVSHISDKAFWGVMKTSQVPVIASHSSCRHFTPGFERNMSDEMIKALAAHGGVIMVNFGSGFVDAKIQKEDEAEFAKNMHRPVGGQVEVLWIWLPDVDRTGVGAVDRADADPG